MYRRSREYVFVEGTKLVRAFIRHSVYGEAFPVPVQNELLSSFFESEGAAPGHAWILPWQHPGQRWGGIPRSSHAFPIWLPLQQRLGTQTQENGEILEKQQS